MHRGKAFVLVLLLAFPVLFFIGLGSWALWERGWGLWLWVLFPLFWGSALILAKMWRTSMLPLKPPDFTPESHWSPLDEKAWKLVQQKTEQAAQMKMEEFTHLQNYVDVAMQLSNDIARTFHPRAKDPFSSLTVPEILAAAELAVEDLAKMVEQYLPASHLLTINHFRRLSKIPDVYNKLAPVGWAVSAVLSPLSTAGRYAMSKSILGPFSKVLQANVLTWFYTHYVHRVGYYLIEMNSGRLRGGAARFRRSLKSYHPGTVSPTTAHAEGEPATGPQEATHVTVSLVGQAGAGKTSLIHALLGKQLEKKTVLERTRSVTEHHLKMDENGQGLILLDTVGYGSGEGAGKEFRKMKDVFEDTDLVLLVMNVTSPARDADRRFLEHMSEWFLAHPELKPPPVLGVLTHIDLLTPQMEWNPPYNWESPTGAKEEKIQQALAFNIETLGDFLVGILPVCTNVPANRVYGIGEWLIPAMGGLMEQAKSRAFVRALQEDIKEGQVQRVFDQMLNVSKSLIKVGMPAFKAWKDGGRK